MTVVYETRLIIYKTRLIALLRQKKYRYVRACGIGVRKHAAADRGIGVLRHWSSEARSSGPAAYAALEFVSTRQRTAASGFGSTRQRTVVSEYVQRRSSEAPS